MTLLVAVLLSVFPGSVGNPGFMDTAVFAFADPSPRFRAQEAPVIKRLTPILTLESIEPSLPFWIEGLGFEKTNEVPEGGGLGFVSLEKDGFEVMLQTRSSVGSDLPDLAEAFARGPSVLFLEVESLEGMEEKLVSLGASVAVPRRQTFYGADEVFFHSPGGHIIGLAVFSGGGS